MARHSSAALERLGPDSGAADKRPLFIMGMLDFLGLPFEESVPNFHESKDLVRTPSTSQVRKPIYKSALEAWKKYEDHLGPLIESLN